MNIWRQLGKQFLALAPMDDVTDSVFRRVVVAAGRPDVMFTEFVNVAGLLSDGRERLLPKLFFQREEKPLIVQIWGNDPGQFREVAVQLVEFGFDGIDINMACPDRAVVKSGCGAALIENPVLAGEIIQAVKEGAGNKLPVSVKTRLGLNNQKTEEWSGFLLQQDLAALTVHARTAAEQSRVPARWEEVAKAVKIRNRLGSKTVIIGNGDIASLAEGRKKAEETGCDGVMIGRGVFTNPWIFSGRNVSEFTPSDRIGLLKYHLDLFQETWGEGKHYPILKKYFKIYIQNFPGAADFRARLMATTELSQANQILGDLTSFG
jgi:nifR3 family TIM-barrel protein